MSIIKLTCTKRLLVLTFFVSMAAYSCVLSQTYVGMTFTGEGRPIPNVQISSLGFDVRSDANGYFHLPKDSGKIVLHFSHPVYF
jgi:hypothetical protein